MADRNDKSDVERSLAEAEARLKALDTERAEVLAKLEALRREREAADSCLKTPAANPFAGALVTMESPAKAKVAFFRSLFRGCEDVYPRRWESADATFSGYEPVCKNKWVDGVCPKKDKTHRDKKTKVVCAECKAREFVPLTDDVVRNHLYGMDKNENPHGGVQRDYVLGVYPLLRDETCWFVAADFDSTSWESDVAAFRDTSRDAGVTVAIERSRSGDGGHAWIFFAEPIPAVTARRLATFLLTETLERRPEIGLDSYDRLYPSQDTMPKGGLGNLIALPLQGRSRERQNSVFLDDDMVPHPDQWAFLSSLKRMERADVERIVEEATRRGRIIGVPMPVLEEADDEPWKTPPSRRRTERPIPGPLPEKLKVRMGNMVFVEKEGVPPALRSRIIRLAAFQNPEFYRAQAMRFSTWGKPRIVSCAEDFAKHIGLPRGCIDELSDLARSLNIAVEVDDERFAGSPIFAKFTGSLRPQQEKAATALLAHKTGVLAAATAFGKTVVAARLIAERGVSTLVLVHRRKLLDQWVAQLRNFLDLEGRTVGAIGGGKWEKGGVVDVAIIQSLLRGNVVDDLVGEYGHVVVDECHHVSASSFERVVRQAKARYVTGLSATVTRKDGHHPIIFMQCGPVRFRVTAKEGAAAHSFRHSVTFRETGFRMPPFPEGSEPTMNEIYDALAADQRRNDMIFEDILACIDRERRSPLVITERLSHLEMFAKRLKPFVRNLVVFHGGMGKL
jgi:hypothetical protein